MDVMYAQVEQAQAIQDYPPFRPCVRLVGIDAAAFASQAFNDSQGCRTHFIDIAWDRSFEEAFVRAMHGSLVEEAVTWVREGMPDDWPDQLWIRLGYTRTPVVTGAYYYEIFANEDPLDISIDSIQLLTGSAVTPPPLATTGPIIATSQAFDLSAFHVGQGMCALLHGAADGLLLDVGAGVPINRQHYRRWLRAPASGAFTNELRLRTHGLNLQAIISHPDSDHWRLLDWDPQLFGATRHIFTPAGAPALALKSSRAIGRVSSLAGTTTVANGPFGQPLLKAHRSSPAASDRNGECLVVETHTGTLGQDHSLFPGDYVYQRMAADGVAAIVGLSSATLDAVMVPHHGDAASASVLPTPRTAQHTAAFFSAGTHIGYGHPTAASISAHATRGFLNIDQHTCADILEHRLP